jgi:hypothetical protein
MHHIRWIRGDWHCRKDNLLLANIHGYTHAYNIESNLPTDVGVIVRHRI